MKNTMMNRHTYACGIATDKINNRIAAFAVAYISRTLTVSDSLAATALCG